MRALHLGSIVGPADLWKLSHIRFNALIPSAREATRGRTGGKPSQAFGNPGFSVDELFEGRRDLGLSGVRCATLRVPKTLDLRFPKAAFRCASLADHWVRRMLLPWQASQNHSEICDPRPGQQAEANSEHAGFMLNRSGQSPFLLQGSQGLQSTVLRRPTPLCPANQPEVGPGKTSELLRNLDARMRSHCLC